MEDITKTKERLKSIKEGGLEKGIKNIREQIVIYTSLTDQIEHLQKVPSGYDKLGEKVGKNEIPALDQWVEQRNSYEVLQKETEIKLGEAYQALMKQLTLLRDVTGIHSKEEAMKFDINTGRQDKDHE